MALYDQNGAVVAGPVDAVDSTITDGYQIVTFTDTVTFPIGKYTYTLKGQLPSTIANGETFSVYTQPSSAATTAKDWTTVKGQTTGVTIYGTPAGSNVTASTMTAKTAAIAITVSGTPAFSISRCRRPELYFRQLSV